MCDRGFITQTPINQRPPALTNLSCYQNRRYELIYKLGENEAHNHLGCGSYGCAYYDPFKCQECHYQTRENVVEISKIGLYDNLANEINLLEYLMRLNPEADFYVAPLYFCVPAENDLKLDDYLLDVLENISDYEPETEIALGQIIFPYAGEEIDKLNIDTQQAEIYSFFSKVLI